MKISILKIVLVTAVLASACAMRVQAAGITVDVAPSSHKVSTMLRGDIL